MRGFYQLACFLAATCVLTIYLTRVPSQGASSQSVENRSAVKKEVHDILPQFGQYKENLEYDYPGISYPIPFNELYADKRKRYVNFGGSFPDLPSGVLTGEVPSFSAHTSDLLLMTGASENHVFPSFNCLYSMVLADPYASYVYLDFGIQNKHLLKLYSHFETILQIQQKMKSTGVLAYRRYNWAHFPRWMSLEHNKKQRGGYAWKVIAEMDVFREWKAMYYWVDAGDVFREGVSRELTLARHYGFYSPYSAGNVQKWVYKDMHKWFMETGVFKHPVPLNTMMIMSGVYVLDYSNSTIRDFMADAFLKCAYTWKCIAPKGSDLSNHRFDQAAMTLLMGYLQVPYAGNLRYRYFPVVHSDLGNQEAKTRVVLNNLLLKIQHTYSITITNKLYNTRGLRFSKHFFKEVSRPQDPTWPDSV